MAQLRNLLQSLNQLTQGLQEVSAAAAQLQRCARLPGMGGWGGRLAAGFGSVCCGIPDGRLQPRLPYASVGHTKLACSRARRINPHARRPATHAACNKDGNGSACCGTL